MFDIIFPNDLEEKLNKNILLVGSGFSKNFGGLLVNEIWHKIYNDNGSNENIRKHLQKSINYEYCFQFLNGNDRKTVFNILTSVFKNFDERIKHAENLYENTMNFLNLFKKDDRYNFIFSTNQDLLIERIQIFEGGQKQPQNIQKDQLELEKYLTLFFPYTNFTFLDMIRNNYNGCIQSQSMYDYDKFQDKIKLHSENGPILNHINYVKMHGSCNWQDEKAEPYYIVGNKKEENINNNNLLKLQFDLL